MVKQRAHCFAGAGHLFDQSLFFGFRHGETNDFGPCVFDSRAPARGPGVRFPGRLPGLGTPKGLSSLMWLGVNAVTSSADKRTLAEGVVKNSIVRNSERVHPLLRSEHSRKTVRLLAVIGVSFDGIRQQIEAGCLDFVPRFRRPTGRMVVHRVRWFQRHRGTSWCMTTLSSS